MATFLQSFQVSDPFLCVTSSGTDSYCSLFIICILFYDAFQ